MKFFPATNYTAGAETWV